MQWARNGIVFILQLLLKISEWLPIFQPRSDAFLLCANALFYVRAKYFLKACIGWLMMFPSINTFFIRAHYSHPQTCLHQVGYSALWHLHSSLCFPFLHFLLSAHFQVPVPLVSWGSRCLVIACLEIPSIQPPGWNPLASVRREIAFLRGQRLCLSVGGNCGIIHTRSTSEIVNEWLFFILNEHKTVSFQALLHLLLLWLFTGQYSFFWLSFRSLLLV